MRPGILRQCCDILCSSACFNEAQAMRPGILEVKTGAETCVTALQ